MVWLLGLAAGLAAAGVRAQELPPLQWMVRDLPPHFSYAKGRVPQSIDELGHGELDGFLRLIVQRMPQYRHEFVDLPFGRFESQVRVGQTLCSILHVRNEERLQWLYFTTLFPPLLERQLHLIVRRDQLDRFEGLGASVSLRDLFARKDLQGLLPQARSFGAQVDAAIVAAGTAAPRTVVPPKQSHLLAMLRAGRMDYTIEYATVALGYQQLQGVDDLAVIPIRDGATTQLATLACSRNAEGRARIEAIDAAVRELARDPRRDAWMRAWRTEPLTPTDRQRVIRYMDERARSGPQIE